jgi:hypothetical protein
MKDIILKRFYEGSLSNDDLVELIKLAGDLLNLKTIPDYCKDAGMSYQGARKDTQTRTNVEIFNVKFIIDNY